MKKKGLPLWGKIAIVIGAVALLLVAIVVLLVVLVFNVVSAPADVANNYMAALDSGNLSEAYGYLSQSTKDETPRSQFDEDKAPFEGSITSYNTSEVQIRNSNAFVPMDITFSNDETTIWYFVLVKEQGDWKILNIYPDEKPSGWPGD